MMKKCGVHQVAMVLVLIGALNWGLVGAFNLDIVEAVLGSWPGVLRVVLVLVGLSAVAMLFSGSCASCKKCEMKK